MNLSSLKKAFPYTIPVLLGYLFLGSAFGILLSSKGYGPLWALVMSITMYAGSGQFVAIGFLTSPFDLVNAFVVSLMVNLRHLFYGLSLLERFKAAGKKRFYMMFSLTDETYSLLCGIKAPKDVDEHQFYCSIGFLDHTYWIVSCVLGNIIGSTIPFNSKGIDFVMTALFMVIFLDQWKESKTHISQFVGISASVLCLLLAGSESFLLPAMSLILIISGILKRRLEAKL